MNEWNLMPNEQVITSSSDGALVLTNCRVKYESIRGSVSAYKSIPLHKVSCCGLNTKKYPLLLVLATLAGLGVLASPTVPGRVLAAIIAIIFGVAYFFTRSGQIEVVSDSGASISVPTKGLKHEDVRRFAEAVALSISKAQ
jgi:hypothetical protein